MRWLPTSGWLCCRLLVSLHKDQQCAFMHCPVPAAAALLLAEKKKHTLLSARAGSTASCWQQRVHLNSDSLLVSVCHLQGCYNVGLPSHKSLFQLQAERLLAVQRLAAAAGDGDGSSQPVRIPWFVMTSPFTHQETL
jgi:hypothetical protein